MKSMHRILPALVVAWNVMAGIPIVGAYAADKSGVSSQTLTLPSGPGSVDGLGESFQPQLNSGTFSYRVPLAFPKCRGDVGPDVTLDYSSGSGNGSAGMGWRLSVPRLQRQTNKGLPLYTDADTIIDGSGEELVRTSEGFYRAKNEGGFIRYTRSNGYWLATLPDGTSLVYGQTLQARQDRAINETFAWFLESAQDLNGNRVEYRYLRDQSQLYLEEVTYGLHATQPSEPLRIKFDYATGRPDPIVDYRGRFRCETSLRLNTITAFHGPRRLKQWRLNYAPEVRVSLLESVQVFGDERSDTSTNAVVNRDFLPPVGLGYVSNSIGTTAFLIIATNVPTLFFKAGEADLVDINRDGLPDILLNDQGTYYSIINRGSLRPWAAPQQITNAPTAAFAAATTRLADLRGDGRSKLLYRDSGGSSFYFRDFLSATQLGTDVDFLIPGSFSLDDPEVQLVDINNDKAMDLMATDGTRFDFLINRQAENGTNYVLPNPPPPPAPGIRFSDGWKLADLNGDHLLDLVFVGAQDEGGTMFHLSKGWGEFDLRGTMSGGPQFIGLEGRDSYHLADLDQDGLADLVMVSGIVKIWFNTGTNRWADPITITDNIPDFDAQTTAIRFADMNGNGTVDIVWNNAPRNGQSPVVLQYLELNPGAKPYQLDRIENGIGRAVRIEYRSSVDYILDALGTPQEWTSVIPFPVPVVSAFTVSDGLGHRYRTEVTYRNGYYDGAEKEFRGFEYAESKEVGNDAESAPSLITASGFDTGRDTEALKGKLLWTETRTEAGSVFSRQTNSWLTRQLPIPTATGEVRHVTFPFIASNVTHVIEGLPSAQAVVLEKEFNFDDFGNPTFQANYGIVQNGNRSAFNDERITATEYALNTNAWILRLPKRTEIKDENGSILSRAEFYYDDETFAGNNLGSVSVGNLTMKREWLWPATNSAYITSTRTKFDAYGNPTTLLDPLASASGDGADFTKGHIREIAYDSRLHTYPVTETIHLGSGKPPLVFQANYDVGLGTVTNSTDFNTNTTTYAYDTFARLTSIVKPGDTPAYPTVEYDYALAVPFASTSLINFVETRLLDKPPGTAGTKRNHYLISRQFVDGIGRKLLTKQEAEPAPGSTAPRVVVSGAVQFNARQQPTRVLNPYFSLLNGSLDDLLTFENIEAPDWTGSFALSNSLVTLDLASAHATRTDYDATLRSTQVTNPDGTQRRTVYEPLLTRSFDENDTDPTSPCRDTPMVHYNDGLGRLVQVDEITLLDDDGMPGGVLRTWTTRYQYNLNDQLTCITDSQNNVNTFAYDGLKRRTAMNDPDRGVMHLLYDDASNLVETTDAKGQRITYTFDGANRILTEKYHDGQPAPAWRNSRGDEALTNSVVYHYDESLPNLPQGDNTVATAQNVKGALAWVEDLSGEEHSSYDQRGRVEWMVKRIPNSQLASPLQPFNASTSLISYKTAFAHDSLERLTNLTYPDADQLRYEYNDRSLLQCIPGGFTGGQAKPGNILSNLIYTPSGQLAQIDYGNGVRTSYAYDSRLRLSRLHSLAPPRGQGEGVSSIDFAYSFDGVSNIKSITDLRPGSTVPEGDPRRNTQLFQFDDLYRLTRVQYSFALPGAASRNDGEINYRFDRINNMLSQTSSLTNHMEKGLPVANLGNMDSGAILGRWNRIGRAPNDPPGPHALTSIRNPQSATRDYPHDSNGNMTNIDGLLCTWDFKDRLVAVENAEMRAAYTFDYTHRRITKCVDYKTSNPQSATRNPQSFAVSYINNYFEVREHDAPTKFVWNGNTRVARVTGSLSTNVRVQRLRVYPGWNLCSLAVSATNTLSQLNNSIPAFSFQLSAFRWEPNTLSWLLVSPNDTLPAGTVLWLQATTNATLTIIGTYADPTSRTVTATGDFLPSASLEVWNFQSAISNLPSASAWFYDAKTTRWLSWLPLPLALQSDLPAFVAPGQAVFARADAPAQLDLPGSALRSCIYHLDHLGSVSAFTDMLGNLVEETAYYPFGCPRREDRTTSRPETYKYTSKEHDAESQLDYFEARYLCGGLARFASPDALGPRTEAPQTLHRYAYTLNNPIRYFDPTGFKEESSIEQLEGAYQPTKAFVDDVVKIYSPRLSPERSVGKAFALYRNEVQPVSEAFETVFDIAEIVSFLKADAETKDPRFIGQAGLRVLAKAVGMIEGPAGVVTGTAVGSCSKDFATVKSEYIQEKLLDSKLRGAGTGGGGGGIIKTTKFGERFSNPGQESKAHPKTSTEFLLGSSPLSKSEWKQRR